MVENIVENMVAAHPMRKAPKTLLASGAPMIRQAVATVPGTLRCVVRTVVVVAILTLPFSFPNRDDQPLFQSGGKVLDCHMANLRGRLGAELLQNSVGSSKVIFNELAPDVLSETLIPLLVPPQLNTDLT